jgi:hypothetical protein
VFYLFIFLRWLFPIATVRHRRLQESPVAQRLRLWEEQGKWSLTILILCALSFSSIHTGLHAKYYYLSLIPYDLGSYKSFHPLWCWVWLVPLWVMVSHPSRCDLTVVRIDVVVWGTLEWWRVGIHQVKWFVMLEPAKDRILGVDTPGQHVPPCVQYGTTCLLIRYAIGYVSC